MGRSRRRRGSAYRADSTSKRSRATRPGTVTRTVFSNETWRVLAGSLRLSHRESQIVPALLDDRKEIAIAADLGISRHTVHTHTERLYRKMGVTSRVELVRCVFFEYLNLTQGRHDGAGTKRSRSS